MTKVRFAAGTKMSTAILRGEEKARLTVRQHHAGFSALDEPIQSPLDDLQETQIGPAKVFQTALPFHLSSFSFPIRRDAQGVRQSGVALPNSTFRVTLQGVLLPTRRV